MMDKNSIESTTDVSEFVDPSSNFYAPVKIERLQDKIKDYDLKLDDLEKECEEIVASSAQISLESLPIENLQDSLKIEHGLSTGKFSMLDLERRTKLEKHYNKLCRERNEAEAELKQTQFDYTLGEIRRLLKELDSTETL